MSRYYLRLEAVNLSNFVGDTQDLSTIRGGGLLLLGAVEGLSIDLPYVGDFREVSTGASAGLYEFEADDDAAPSSGIVEGVRSYVEGRLKGRDGLRYATVVADVRPAGQSFSEDLQALTACNRWRQMQSPSVVLDPGPSDGPCEVDKVRPAVKQARVHDQEMMVSESVFDRREHGRQMRQEIYREVVAAGDGAARRAHPGRFVRDLGELAEDPDKGNLNGKMAVIHLDGNDFGGIKAAAGDSREVWERFDRTVKEYRRRVLDSLLDAMKDDPDWKTPSGRYRVETLLWGGDEILWVVPAWKGWETLRLFYDWSADWEFDGRPLRHAAGMIFCHHRAPIHRLTRLADELSDQAKGGDGREHNRFAYEVLESFDHVGSDFAAYRLSHCVQPLTPGTLPDPGQLILDSSVMPFLKEQAASLREKLPRRKLHQVVELLLTPPGDAAAVAARQAERGAAVRDLKDRLGRAGVPNAQVRELEARLGGEACWLHLNALWDYLV